MRAVMLCGLDGPESMKTATVEAPTPTGQQILIDVHCAGVSFPDVLQSRGQYQLKPALPFTPGGEVAGVIRSVPAGSSFAVGDRVAAFVGIGGFAEQAVADPEMVFPLPDQYSFELGASLPMNMLTSHFALTRRGHLVPGETILVHGAGGGIGTATIYLARRLGAHVLAVASSQAKGAAAISAGAHTILSADDFLSQARQLTSGRGVDMVVDPVGGPRFTDSLRALSPEGRLLVVGFTAGQIPEVRVNRLLLNNISVVGVGWGSFVTRNRDLPGEQWLELLALLDAEQLSLLPLSSYPLDQAAFAMEQLEARMATGKMVLQVRDGDNTGAY